MRFRPGCFAVAAVAFSLTVSCRLDDLIRPTDGAPISVNPALVADSATVGSRAMRNSLLAITGDGMAGTPWDAAVARKSDWLEVAQTGDTVPASLAVGLRPEGLGAGIYQDTILITWTAGEAPVRVPVRFQIMPPAAALQLAFTTQPSSARAGSSLSPPVEVTAFDANGNPSADFEGAVTIAMGANPAGASLSGATTVQAKNGTATFENLKIDRPGSGYTLQAFSSGLASTTSAAFDITGGAISPERSIVSTSPQYITASGGSSTSTITVTVRDEQGNTMSGVPVTISVSGDDNRLSATSGTTNGEGVVTFTYSSPTAGPRVVTAFAGGVDVGSEDIIVNPAGAAILTFRVQPSDAEEGRNISPAIEVAALDPFGNSATGFEQDITMTIASGDDDARLSGSTRRRANDGVASFNNLRINREGRYTLRASAAGVGSVVSAAFDIEDD